MILIIVGSSRSNYNDYDYYYHNHGGGVCSLPQEPKKSIQNG